MRKSQILGSMVVLCMACLMLFSCGITTEELAKQVQDSILETMADSFEGHLVGATQELEVEEALVLVKKSKTEYSGLLTLGSIYKWGGFTEREKLRYFVEVIYDGKTFQWNAEGL
ncbi:MAG: hypothetical protein FWD26_01515 [Treponema sp.]|nr:hypothetical protein [Treponema sp.]